jgi:hypothetical protein
MADPTQGLPPQFVGRYPGAPIPVAAPPAVSQFVPRYSTSAPGTTSGAVPVYQPAPAAPAAPAAPIGQPIDTAMLNANTQGAPVVPAPQPTVIGNAAPAANADGSPPPLPPNMTGQNGTTAMPTGPVPGPSPAAAPALPPANTWAGFAARDNTLFDPFGNGGGGSSLANLPGGGSIVNGHFADPRDAIAYGYQQQLAYQQASMANLMRFAGSGSDLGYHARVSALAQAIGLNNFGQMQGMGADALNQSIAGETEAQTNAAASEQVENTRAAAERYATDAGKDVGVVGEVPNVPGMPMMGTHPIYGVRERGADGNYTGRVIPFQQTGAAAAPGSPGGDLPTIDQYVATNRALNPGMTDDQLKQKYYGMIKSRTGQQ